VSRGPFYFRGQRLGDPSRKALNRDVREENAAKVAKNGTSHNSGRHNWILFAWN
jgi:hypothetical protein